MVPWTLLLLVSSALCVLKLPCRNVYDFDSCIKSTLQSIISELRANGSPELGIGPLDPVQLPDLEFEVNRRSAAGMSAPLNKAVGLAATVHFLNTTAFGLSQLQLLAVRSELKKLQIMVDIQVLVPRMFLRGNFYINGRFGVLPIVGGGPFNITTGEVHGDWRLRGKQIEREDGPQLLLEECKLTPRIAYLHLEADNFLRSNPALSKTVVGFTNRFWPLLYDDSLPQLEQNLEKFGLNILNKIFTEVSFNDIFPNTTTQKPSKPTTKKSTTKATSRRPTTQRTTKRPTTRRTQKTTTQRISTQGTTQKKTEHTTQKKTRSTTRRIIKLEFLFLG